MSFSKGMFVGLAVTLAGCWTVRETVHESVAVGALPSGKEVRVQLAGFDAVVTSLVPTYGYTTIMDSGSWYGRHGRHRHGYGMTTVSTTEFVPHAEKTFFYRNRATDTLEKAGCILQTTTPQYRVEVRFEGPYDEAGDGWAAAGWMLCTIFTTDYGAQNWTAKLKIHDLKTGRLVHEQDFVERDEALVWGPIPIFSPSFSDRTSEKAMQHLCLTALTDRAVANALKFFSAK